MVIGGIQKLRISSYDYRVLMLVVTLCCLGIMLAKNLAPQDSGSIKRVALEQNIPLILGNWRAVGVGNDNPMLNPGGASTDQPYDEILYRTYQNSITGKTMSLAIAWGKSQRQEIKIHRPELCYAAQGFEIQSISRIKFRLPVTKQLNTVIPGKKMTAAAAGTSRQVVAYWIRIGGLFSENALETRVHLIAEGLAGRIPDGVLVRVSMLVPNPGEDVVASSALDEFLSALIGNLSVEMQSILIGDWHASSENI